MQTFVDGIRKNAGLVILFGVLLIILGVFAMGSPFVAGISVAIMVGSLLAIGGVVQFFASWKTKAGFMSMLVALLTLAAGVYMIANPGVALATLTLFLAGFLLASGIFEVMFAFQVKPADGWIWALLGGVMSIVLGGLIWAQFPVSGALAIGILLGIRLIFSGMSLLMMGIAVRSATGRIQDNHE